MLTVLTTNRELCHALLNELKDVWMDDVGTVLTTNRELCHALLNELKAGCVGPLH
jgi:hypothetical protein